MESNVFSFFNSSKGCILFEVIFLLRLDSFASKFVFLTKFACANLVSTPEVLSSGVVIYWSWFWSVSFFSISVIFVLSVFLTKLLILGILFSTVVNAAFVAKPLILDILPSLSVILAL